MRRSSRVTWGVAEGVLTGCVRPWGLWRLPLWCGWWSCGPVGECGDLPAQTNFLHLNESSCYMTDFWKDNGSRGRQKREREREKIKTFCVRSGKNLHVGRTPKRHITSFNLHFYSHFNVYLPLCDVLSIMGLTLTQKHYSAAIIFLLMFTSISFIPDIFCWIRTAVGLHSSFSNSERNDTPWLRRWNRTRGND